MIILFELYNKQGDYVDLYYGTEEDTEEGLLEELTIQGWELSKVLRV